MKRIPVTLYISVLVITAVIFIGAWMVSVYINNQKTAIIKNEEDAIATQILSLQARTDILTANINTSLCASSTSTGASATTTAKAIATSLTDLQNKLSFMQSQLGPDNPDLFRLERYYSLMEIKDYNLEQTIIHRCALPVTTSRPFILYFYPTGTCAQCVTQGYILQAVTQKYPQAHIYSFNYDSDWAAVESLIALPPIPATTTPPFFIVNGSVYPAFSDLSSMQTALEKSFATIKNVSKK